MILRLTSDSEEATGAIAARLARLCKTGDCILLKGDLGAGKTAFARGFIHALAPECDEVVSPTFTLVQAYEGDNGIALRHFDLYRLRHPEELLELGLEDALGGGISLIEWPEIAQDMLPKDALEVRITMGDNDQQRRFIFAGADAAWQDRLKII